MPASTPSACAYSEASLLSALDGPAPQLVLSDVNMPGFDGPHALAIVRERAPAARFVFLTGAIAEDATLPEADGVLLKHELHELPRLVRRLLERSEEHTSGLQSLMRISYAVFCLKKKKQPNNTTCIASR